MFKKMMIIMAAAMLITPALLFAGGSTPKCNTKYPVILAHGMGATDDMLGFINYWWGIEAALEDEGANVFVTKVNCMDSTYNKGLQFKTQFLQILAATGKLKANIIGHSHGGIYTRYAITNLGLGTKAASLTTLCTPHRGSSAADVIIGVLGDKGGWLVGATLDVVYAFLMGDTSPQSYDNAIAVSRPFMNNTFNPQTPNVAGVYYQSYATKINYADPSVVLTPTWLLIAYYEGTNDGLVSETSAKWGTYRGITGGSLLNPGVSHINAINHFFGVTPGYDAKAYFVSMVQSLKDKGY
jgi:triacylglycerol lipase